uniref:Uncharacterized protein n=1 Tax=Arundo donax TaxID=35708 RepID=A0A0A9HX24_ARUDO
MLYLVVGTVAAFLFGQVDCVDAIFVKFSLMFARSDG